MRRIRGVADAKPAPGLNSSEKDVTVIEHPNGVIVNCYGYAVLLDAEQATAIADDILTAVEKIKQD